MIDKQTAIAALENNNYNGLPAAVVAECVKVIRALPEEDGWIPVTERMPEDDLPINSHRKMIRCLVATDKGTVKACVRQRYEKRIDGEWIVCPWEWNKDLFANPTHWMYLPEPPKEEK